LAQKSAKTKKVFQPKKIPSKPIFGGFLSIAFGLKRVDHLDSSIAKIRDVMALHFNFKLFFQHK